MRKGTIVLVPFPFTDLSGQKVRPALVLYASIKGENCIVAFITSISGRELYPFDVTVSASKRNGLKVNSVVKLDHLATLQKRSILGRLGILESSLVESINERLKALFRL